MPTQKTREELEDRIEELGARSCRTKLTPSLTLSKARSTRTTRGVAEPACGAGWHKEVVTDRRFRQRAVECRPADHVNSCVNWHLIGFAFH